MPRPSSPNTASRFITRMPDNCWRVWVTFKKLDLGQVYVSDREHGGKEAAYRAALACRDRLVQEHGIPLRAYAGNGFHVQDKRSQTGVVGITLAVDNPEAPTKVNWRAKFRVNGRVCSVAKSIRRYGYVTAWRLVAQARRKHTGQPVPDNPPPAPQWLMRWAIEKGIAL